MAELTIQIPDDLADRLKPFQDRLPALLTRLMEMLPAGPERQEEGKALAASLPSDVVRVYTEVLEFLLTRPTPQDVLAFKVSATAQTRLRSLLDKNREDHLDAAESAELDLYEQLEQLMILLKAKAGSMRSA